ncbi:hypothetical protein [Absidia glauca]|uniref:MULE transposase domain-containing protein n=1 Tax=Absidia glauca TaxID=4829 RepID=A0A168M263_ABSGL|nr:hypothetical protein [Absidia glauca]
MPTIYNGNNIKEALLPHNDVMKLPLNTDVQVYFNEWEECLKRIQELCGKKWLRRSLYRGDTRNATVLFRKVFCCHRSGVQGAPIPTIRPNQKASKKVGCQGVLQVTQYRDREDLAIVRLTMDHTNHVVGSRSELRTLPPRSDVAQSAGYGDVYNELMSLARDFQSPDQVVQMSRAVSFCLDSTHGISRNSHEVLYTLVIKHPGTGAGFPTAYMITNDQSVGPLNQWLAHLRTTSSFGPLSITIDCRIPEVNAIKRQFPSAIIHYCAFHVIQAWKRQLKAKVRLDASFTSSELGRFREYILSQLKALLFEPDLDSLHQQLADFVNEHNGSHCDEFIDYFVDLVAINSGRMGPMERENAIRRAKTRAVTFRMGEMITNPENDHRNDVDPVGVWKVESFVTAGHQYDVRVDQNRSISPSKSLRNPNF